MLVSRTRMIAKRRQPMNSSDPAKSPRPAPMRVLHQTLAVIALVILVIQPARISYARWIEPRTPGRDRETRSVQTQILLVGSLDDLVARQEALRKQAAELRRSQSGSPSSPWYKS